MAPSAFDDRTVTLDGSPEQLASVANVLASRTRLAILATLARSSEPLNMNEIGRRIGVDASPVRTHLELLAKEGLVREVNLEVGRERKFETSLRDVRITLEGIHRARAPEKGKAPSKLVQRIQKRLAALEAEEARLAGHAAKLKAELAKAWDEPTP